MHVHLSVRLFITLNRLYILTSNIYKCFLSSSRYLSKGQVRPNHHFFLYIWNRFLNVLHIWINFNSPFQPYLTLYGRGGFYFFKKYIYMYRWSIRNRFKHTLPVGVMSVVNIFSVTKILKIGQSENQNTV